MSDTFYYSADGDRIPLQPSPDTLIIVYQGEVPPKNLESLVRSDDDLAKFVSSPQLQQRQMVLYKRSPNARIPLDTFARRIAQSDRINYVTQIYYLGDSPRIVHDEFIVALKPEVSRQRIDELNNANNVEIVNEIDFAPNTFLLRVRNPSTRAALDMANRYYETGLVEYSEPNFIQISLPAAPFIPNDPLFPQQWHLPRVQAPDAWSITQGDAAVVIAVVDDGVDLDHEDLASPGKIVSGKDFVSGDNDPRPSLPTDNHGTSVAGVATANGNNGIGVTGVAPHCRLMAIRFIGAITTEQEAQTFRFASDNGASIINNSWVKRSKGAAPVPLPGIVRSAYDYATNTGRGGKGCIILFAAGNFNQLVAPDSYVSYDRVIPIAACNDVNVRADYSNFGPEISVCAPSNDTLPGHLGITTTDRMGSAGAPGNYINNFGGTSSACPLTAGIAALVLSINPSLTWQQVKYILEATADKIDTANTNAIAQYQASGHSQWYGYGRVNAFEAVKSARSSVPERDFVQQTFVTLRRTTGDRFVSTQVVHAIDARQRQADTPSDVFVRGGPDGFLHLQLGPDLANQFTEVNVN